jgi:hypothetical protein
VSEQHPDDEFHPPTSDDPYWTETCWFTFTVPERRLSGQLYPFFQPNQGVLSAGAYFWDHTGHTPADILHARQFWHLPIPDQPLSDIQLPNGISYRCLEPLHRYELTYDDPDALAVGGTATGDVPESNAPESSIHVELTFSALAPPNYLGASHLDQPGRYVGTIVLAGERIAVDAFGFRDRSWGPRTQFGRGMHSSPALSGGYSYATSSDQSAFHAITMDFGSGSMAIHGYIIRDGQRSTVASGTRRVLERDRAHAYPLRVALDLVDELGRELHAEGECRNGLGLFLNPNLYTVNCLTEWTFDGRTAFGEDHDNWSATGIQQFRRQFARTRGDHTTEGETT